MIFDTYAKNWDTPRRIKRAAFIAKEIDESTSKCHYKKALEFGCGTGLISFNLIHLIDRLTLVDTSEAMIQVVHKKIEAGKFLNIDTKKLDLVNASISEKYDLIYSSMVLHHILDTRRILEKFYELLTTGGECCLVDLVREPSTQFFHLNEPGFSGHHGFNQKEMIDMMTTIGFKEVTVNTFYKGKKVIQDQEVQYSLFRIIGKK